MVHNVTEQMFERQLVQKYPEHRKLIRTLGWIERAPWAATSPITRLRLTTGNGARTSASRTSSGSSKPIGLIVRHGRTFAGPPLLCALGFVARRKAEPLRYVSRRGGTRDLEDQHALLLVRCGDPPDVTQANAYPLTRRSRRPIPIPSTMLNTLTASSAESVYGCNADRLSGPAGVVNDATLSIRAESTPCHDATPRSTRARCLRHFRMQPGIGGNGFHLEQARDQP
jgi:hypothetical protein